MVTDRGAPNLDSCSALDARPDPMSALAARFAHGAPGTLYFDANSIGPMPIDAPERVRILLEQGWRIGRRRGWNTGDWIDQPRKLGAAIAPLIGAGTNDVIVCDSTSINQYKLLRFALEAAAPRKVIVVERAVFPTNRYVCAGIAHASLATLRDIDGPDDLEAALAPGDVAVVALSHVDYRNGARLDMAAMTAIAHRHGATVLWDLSHSAGAVAVRLEQCDVDFAIGCGYKYLCGGPGAPSLLYVHPRWQDRAWPAIAGWMGHADTFAFSPDYTPASGIDRHLAGTPAVIANTAFMAAADIWRDVDPDALDTRHRSLTNLLIALLDQHCAPLGIEVTSSREHSRRGGHVAVRLALPDANIDALGQALVAAGVIVSTRKPDSLRFGVHPLTTRHVDLWHAVERLAIILKRESWRDPRFSGQSI